MSPISSRNSVPLGQLEQPFVVTDSTGKRALYVAEQLGFQ